MSPALCHTKWMLDKFFQRFAKLHPCAPPSTFLAGSDVAQHQRRALAALGVCAAHAMLEHAEGLTLEHSQGERRLLDSQEAQLLHANC